MFEAKKFFNIFDVTSYIKLFAFGLRMAVVILFIMGIVWVKNFMFPAKKKLMHQVITVEKGGTIINNDVDEKNWEIGAFGGALEYDRKNGWFGGLEIKRRF
jgi:hypothetical protein